MMRVLALSATCLILICACASRSTDRSQADTDAEIARLRAIVSAGDGDAASGKMLFTQRCGACHTLHAVGGQVGPDLTPYLRDPENADFILRSIVTPSALVHEYHPTFVLSTTAGQEYTGTVVDDTRASVTLAMPGGERITVPRADIASLTERAGSLMPAQTLAGLTDAQVADLFAYINKP